MVVFSRFAAAASCLVGVALASTTPALSSSSEVAIAAPPTIKLQSRAVPGGSSFGRRRRRRALDPVTVPLADYFKGTDLQWFGNISVGTPPQDITVVFDTGSTTLEFASTLCSACSHQIQFDPEKSSTYIDGGQEETLRFSTGGGVDPVQGNNWVLTMRNASETVAVGGLDVKNSEVYLITDQTTKFDDDPFSGIMGMDTDAEFFQALVAQSLPAIFGMYFTPNSVGEAEITFGGIDTSKFQGPLTYIPIYVHSGSWDLASSKITVNGHTNSILTAHRTIVFDSGTSNILFPSATANAIYALIHPDIKPYPALPGAYGIPCSKLAEAEEGGGLDAEIGYTVIDENGEEFELTIPSGELNVGPFEGDEEVCQMLINAYEGWNVVGGSAMKHWYTVHDVENMRMGFARNGV